MVEVHVLCSQRVAAKPSGKRVGGARVALIHETITIALALRLRGEA
jgi:hypothetical protein